MPETLVSDGLSADQQNFPRIMLFEFYAAQHNDHGAARLELHDAWPNAFPDGPVELADGRVQGFALPSQLGEILTDNSYSEDGYRFHDAFHIGVMAGTGWSPVMRSLLQVKRRGDPLVDEVDDGGRSIGLEESLVDFLGIGTANPNEPVAAERLDFAVGAVQSALRSRGCVDRFEDYELRQALTQGAELYGQVRRQLGGFALANLDDRSVRYLPLNAIRNTA